MTARVWYNEIDPYAAAWLRNLGKSDVLQVDEVQELSISMLAQVHDRLSDPLGPERAHFFAGIGGWELALQLAGWPDSFPVWTGSCPCQPFSVAGQGKGVNDERHLWPQFFRLIRLHHPPIVFGEQVASAAGRDWLAGVRADLESLGYEVGSADLCAAGVGAPHIRQRLYWVAIAGYVKRRGRNPVGAAVGGHDRAPGTDEAGGGGRHDQGGIGQGLHAADDRAGGGVADATSVRCEGGIPRREQDLGAFESSEQVQQSAGHGDAGGLGDASGAGLEERSSIRREPSGAPEPVQGEAVVGAGGEFGSGRRGPGAWGSYDWIPCLDNKARRLEPGLVPLVDGLPGRVGRLRAYGNAIVPQVAATFVKVVMEYLKDEGVDGF